MKIGTNVDEERGNLFFLDGLRGLAALYVVIGHARWLLWEGYSIGFLNHPAQYSILGRIAVYASSLFIYGHEAVLFFFVLSGFVIHLRYAKKLRLDGQYAGFGWSDYVWRRAKRLYPPLVLAMALTFALDSLGTRLGYPIYFRITAYPLINQNVISDHSWQTGLGNLIFVMNSYVPVWGTNGPLWSLKFEWWFYMIYPLFWWVSKKSIVISSTLMAILWMASFYPGLWAVSLLREVFSMMLAWWFGVMLADIFAGRIQLSFKALSPFSLLVFILPFLTFDSRAKDLLWGLAFTGVIALGLALRQKASRVVKPLERLKPLGDLSYTLYVIHFPLLVFISGYVMSRTDGYLLPPHFGWAALGIILCISLAYVVHMLVETPFLPQYKSPQEYHSLGSVKTDHAIR